MPLAPADRPTVLFVGVATGGSAIVRVFPAWAEALGLDAVLRSVDLPLGTRSEQYLDLVRSLRDDPQLRGAVVTSHKLGLYTVARHLFAEVGEEAELLGEVSAIGKRGGGLRADATDPAASGLTLAAIVPEGYWAEHGAELAVLGAGGSARALTLHLHRLAVAGADAPVRVVVTDTSVPRLDETRAVHERLGFALPVEYHHVPTPAHNDALVAHLASGSMVVNATGLGKDQPGSPLTDDAVFPEGAVAWDFNYRGDLVFLDQARAQAARGVRVEDGWRYFVHGWTRALAAVFGIDLPTGGPAFERLSVLPRTAAGS